MILKPAELGLLQKCALFLSLEAEEMTELLAGDGVSRKTYPKGAVIYAPHDFFRSLGVILSGSVAVSKGDFPVNELKPGELFGAAALYNEEADYVTTLRACRDCDILLLSDQKVDELLSQSPKIRRNYIRYLSGRIRFLSSKMEALTGPTVEAKLLCYLEQRSREGRAVMDCSMLELAKRLGMGRASLYRAFDILEHQGMIRRDGKTVLLLNKKG